MKVTYWLNKCGKKILRDKAKEESLCPILPDFISIQI
jgi:G:T-mismatch repair DNA endonuclease (very short patch repair protein)